MTSFMELPNGRGQIFCLYLLECAYSTTLRAQDSRNSSFLFHFPVLHTMRVKLIERLAFTIR